jgi:hypothetical protein
MRFRRKKRAGAKRRMIGGRCSAWGTRKRQSRSRGTNRGRKSVIAESCSECREVAGPLKTDEAGQLRESLLRGRRKQCETEEEGVDSDRGKIGDEGSREDNASERWQSQSRSAGLSKLSKNSTISFGQEADRIGPVLAEFPGIGADRMDTQPGVVAVEPGLEGAGQGGSDVVRELGVVKDAKPRVDAMIDSLSATGASHEKVKRSGVDNDTFGIKLGGNGGGIRGRSIEVGG